MGIFVLYPGNRVDADSSKFDLARRFTCFAKYFIQQGRISSGNLEIFGKLES